MKSIEQHTKTLCLNNSGNKLIPCLLPQHNEPNIQPNPTENTSRENKENKTESLI